jgi:CheY-like chemotaxis protein
MDIRMPGCDGVEGTRLIKQFDRNIKVVMLTTFGDEESITRAVENGADGYVLKDVTPEELKNVIKNVAHGFLVFSGKAGSALRRGINMQEAITHYRVIAKGELVDLLECTIETGRTHQIRRHLVAMAHPVAGDRRYGVFPFYRELKSRYGLKRMFLHAQRIEFEHPIHGNKMVIEAPLPPELLTALRRMGIEPPK